MGSCQSRNTAEYGEKHLHPTGQAAPPSKAATLGEEILLGPPSSITDLMIDESADAFAPSSLVVTKQAETTETAPQQPEEEEKSTAADPPVLPTPQIPQNNTDISKYNLQNGDGESPSLLKDATTPARPVSYSERMKQVVQPIYAALHPYYHDDLQKVVGPGRSMTLWPQSDPRRMISFSVESGQFEFPSTFMVSLEHGNEWLCFAATVISLGDDFGDAMHRKKTSPLTMYLAHANHDAKIGRFQYESDDDGGDITVTFAVMQSILGMTPTHETIASMVDVARQTMHKHCYGFTEIGQGKSAQEAIQTAEQTFLAEQQDRQLEQRATEMAQAVRAALASLELDCLVEEEEAAAANDDDSDKNVNPLGRRFEFLLQSRKDPLRTAQIVLYPRHGTFQFSCRLTTNPKLHSEVVGYQNKAEREDNAVLRVSDLFLLGTEAGEASLMATQRLPLLEKENRQHLMMKLVRTTIHSARSLLDKHFAQIMDKMRRYELPTVRKEGSD